MNYWPFSDKLLRAKATVKVNSEYNVYPVIYSGYDFTLLTDSCQQACLYGLSYDSYWYPPHKIDNILFEVIGWDGTFEEWEQECIMGTIMYNIKTNLTVRR